MPESIYGIQLFDDIHNYLPDILYNSERFRNITDLLSYIRQQIDYNSPYNRGLREHTMAVRRRNILENTPAITASIHTIPISVNGSGTTNPTINILDQLLGRDIGANLGPQILSSFLNSNVIVRPTTEQINNATTTNTVNVLRLTDDCSICQDGMIQNEEIRTINHCGHKFHKDCIDIWFQTNVRCPICRHDIRENTVQSESHPVIESRVESTTPSPTFPVSSFRSSNNE